jgi:Arc/MetJ-type ribon-helix-helix transcriptional regulator
MHPTYPPDLLSFVEHELSHGAYSCEDDLLIAGVRVLREMKLRHDQLRADVQHAIKQADNGETSPMDVEATKAEGRKHLAQREQSR